MVTRLQHPRPDRNPQWERPTHTPGPSFDHRQLPWHHACGHPYRTGGKLFKKIKKCDEIIYCPALSEADTMQNKMKFLASEDFDHRCLHNLSLSWLLYMKKYNTKCYTMLSRIFHHKTSVEFRQISFDMPPCPSNHAVSVFDHWRHFNVPSRI